MATAKAKEKREALRPGFYTSSETAERRKLLLAANGFELLSTLIYCASLVPG